MRTFAIILASVPALVLGQADSFGLGSPTTLATLTSPPSVPAIPSITGFKVLRRTEATPCPTTTTAAGLLDVLRREEDSAEGSEGAPSTQVEAPPSNNTVESSPAEPKKNTSSSPADSGMLSNLPIPLVGNRDLGLPSLGGVLGGSTSSKAASTTTRPADTAITPAANQTVPPPGANNGTAHNGTIAANVTSSSTSYPSPKVTKTDFPFDSAAVNGAPSTSAAEPSQTVAARDLLSALNLTDSSSDSSTSSNSTSGLDTNSKYVCSADVVASNSTNASNATITGTASSANATDAPKTAYHCYLRHPNGTNTTTTQSATGTGTTFLTITTQAANLTNAEVSQTTTDTFSVTSLATHPASTEASATTSSGTIANDLLAAVTGVLRL
ncbi:hypothetical protein M409DRAFT_29193 [Zasmidium cellare ATCC 36951]|uniref:Uncharacterized protein n=1 Tax=Zasmidium cellare ATCC 36951 TaxID=1080233 RepID=A0A6A6C0D9_ZASCE|nr:uncharacterized protein M409DRAFT_29193 [Zasmidium cellare ATCC 36951]KAF2160343.1 hypothetical protein M409DRAFT_29193 [Zasmidium cellare ATCC 36951]